MLFNLMVKFINVKYMFTIKYGDSKYLVRNKNTFRLHCFKKMKDDHIFD